MPKPFLFKLTRQRRLANNEALEKNKELAEMLLDKFEGLTTIGDVNYPILAKVDSPQLHFKLLSQVRGFVFIISFWNNAIVIRMEAGHRPDDIFAVVSRYSKVIMDYGFNIQDPVTEDTYGLGNGITINKIVYQHGKNAELQYIRGILTSRGKQKSRR